MNDTNGAFIVVLSRRTDSYLIDLNRTVAVSMSNIPFFVNSFQHFNVRDTSHRVNFSRDSECFVPSQLHRFFHHSIEITAKGEFIIHNISPLYINSAFDPASGEELRFAFLGGDLRFLALFRVRPKRKRERDQLVSCVLLERVSVQT